MATVLSSPRSKGWMKSIIFVVFDDENSNLMNHNSHKTLHSNPLSKPYTTHSSGTPYTHLYTQQQHAKIPWFFSRWNSIEKIFHNKNFVCALSLTFVHQVEKEDKKSKTGINNIWKSQSPVNVEKILEF